jgi:hypothetical protein
MLHRSLEELHRKIMSGVLRCQSRFESSDLDAIIVSRSSLYPHNPFIFFGVGLHIVRYAIETQSECLAMMIPSYFFNSFPLCETLPHYQPRYHLPTMVPPSPSVLLLPPLLLTLVSLSMDRSLNSMRL